MKGFHITNVHGLEVIAIFPTSSPLPVTEQWCKEIPFGIQYCHPKQNVDFNHKIFEI